MKSNANYSNQGFERTRFQSIYAEGFLCAVCQKVANAPTKCLLCDAVYCAFCLQKTIQTQFLFTHRPCPKGKCL